MINFGNAIKKYRVASKLTQKELAEKVNITPEYLSSLENSRKSSSFGLLADLCKALNLPPEVLFWDAVEITGDIKDEDKKVIETAKVLIRYYLESNNPSAQEP